MKQLYGNFKEKEWVKMDHHCGFTFLNSFNESEIMRRLKTYFKFMFVRNPAERALSVYRNKFNEIESFYKVYGKKIMLMYHEESPMVSHCYIVISLIVHAAFFQNCTVCKKTRHHHFLIEKLSCSCKPHLSQKKIFSQTSLF